MFLLLLVSNNAYLVGVYLRPDLLIWLVVSAKVFKEMLQMPDL